MENVPATICTTVKTVSTKVSDDMFWLFVTSLLKCALCSLCSSQLADDCRTDGDCNNHGTCHDVDATSDPRYGNSQAAISLDSPRQPGPITFRNQTFFSLVGVFDVADFNVSADQDGLECIVKKVLNVECGHDISDN